MVHLRIMLPLLALAAALLARPAYAHGFGERYDLPVPLGYLLVGAGAAVVLSFVVIGLFVRGSTGHGAYWRYNLFRRRWVRLIMASPLLLAPIKLLSVFLLGLVIATGLFGSQIPSLNFSPTFVWVIWWVGMGFVVALIGNLWALINPWKIVFEWAEGLYTRFRPGGSLSFNDEYPRAWGIWPAVVLFLLFAWLENGYSESALPARLGVMAIVYSAITLGGMVFFGKHQWLRHGEAFSVVFGFLARFAPTEVRVSQRELCRRCDGRCLDMDDDCVNCYECFEKASFSAYDAVGNPEVRSSPANPSISVATKEVNIRPFAVGLARREGISSDMLVMVILLLSAVTFDGLSATPAWVEVQSQSLDIFSGLLNNIVLNGLTIADTLGLVLFPVAFLLVYLSFSYMMARSVGGTVGVGDLARAFVYSLIPITLAYNIAHFITLLIVQGQLIVPLASDPFGRGWDLFGTSGYTVDIGVIDAKVLWFLSVAVIVAGHIIAVYLAHRISMRLFSDRLVALKSQFPMLALMVMYTVVSLLIIAQPILD